MYISIVVFRHLFHGLISLLVLSIVNVLVVKIYEVVQLYRKGGGGPFILPISYAFKSRDVFCCRIKRLVTFVENWLNAMKTYRQSQYFPHLRSSFSASPPLLLPFAPSFFKPRIRTTAWR